MTSPNPKPTDAYRPDPDLYDVLAKANREELQIVHDIVAQPITEMLTIKKDYKLNHPKHEQYVDLLEFEARANGGNTIANFFRGGEGPAYRVISRDVAKSVGAPFHHDQDIAVIEAAILSAILAKAVEELTEEQKRIVLAIVGKPNLSFLGGASVLAFQAVFRAGGFASYQLMLIVVNTIVKAMLGRGLPLAANTVLTRSMSVVVGPLGLAVSALVTAIQVAGPAYRVTIPVVVYVAMLRYMQNALKCGQCGAVMNESFKHCSECGAPLSEPEPQGDAT